jgi:hypothetical protein
MLIVIGICSAISSKGRLSEQRGNPVPRIATDKVEVGGFNVGKEVTQLCLKGLVAYYFAVEATTTESNLARAKFIE